MQPEQHEADRENAEAVRRAEAEQKETQGE